MRILSLAITSIVVKRIQPYSAATPVIFSLDARMKKTNYHRGSPPINRFAILTFCFFTE